MWTRNLVAALALASQAGALEFLSPAWEPNPGKALTVGVSHSSSQWGNHEESALVTWDRGDTWLRQLRGGYGFGWMGFDPATETSFAAAIHRVTLGGDLVLADGRSITRFDWTSRIEAWEGGAQGIHQARVEERWMFERIFLGAALSAESSRISNDLRFDPALFAGFQLPQGLQVHGQLGYLGMAPETFAAVDRLAFSVQAIYGWSEGNRLSAGVVYNGKNDLRIGLGYRQQFKGSPSSWGLDSLTLKLTSGVSDGVTAELAGVFRHALGGGSRTKVEPVAVNPVPVKIDPPAAVVSNTVVPPALTPVASVTNLPPAETNGAGAPTSTNLPASNETVAPKKPEPSGLALAPLCNETGDAAMDPLADIFPVLLKNAVGESLLGKNLKADRSLDQILYFMRQQYRSEIDGAIRQILLERFAVRWLVISRLKLQGKTHMVEVELIDLIGTGNARRTEGALPADKSGYGAFGQTLMDHLLDPYGK